MPLTRNYFSKTCFWICLFSCLIYNAAAQTGGLKKTYVYQDLNSYKVFLENTESQNGALLDKKLQKQYKEIINGKNDALLKQLSDKGFLFDAEAYPYLNSILNHILEKNSLDKNQFHFFIDRSPEVNAYSYEDGTVVCNLGLLSIMENESQIAMIFCHELGHCLLKHGNTAIVTQLKTYNSPEFLAKVKAIKSQQYRVNTQLEGLLMSDVFDRRKHTRSKEWAADSLGIELFRKTNYGGKNVSHLFDLLDSTENKTTAYTIRDFFRKEKIDLDASWFRPAGTMRFGDAQKQEITDSLKTHPDCGVRKIKMQAVFDRNPKPGADYLFGSVQKLAAIRKIAMFDEAAFGKDKDNYGFYLYQLIQNDGFYPQDSNIKTSILDALVAIGKHQKSHTLYTIVKTPYITEDDHDEYAKLLKLLNTISLDKLINITGIYYGNNKALIAASNETMNDYKTLNN